MVIPSFLLFFLGFEFFLFLEKPRNNVLLVTKAWSLNEKKLKENYPPEKNSTFGGCCDFCKASASRPVRRWGNIEKGRAKLGPSIESPQLEWQNIELCLFFLPLSTAVLLPIRPLVGSVTHSNVAASCPTGHMVLYFRTNECRHRRRWRWRWMVHPFLPGRPQLVGYFGIVCSEMLHYGWCREFFLLGRQSQLLSIWPTATVTESELVEIWRRHSRSQGGRVIF